MASEPIVDFDPAEPTEDFRCGKSMFSDNVWDFNGYVDVNHLSGARLMINFEAFSHKPRMLYTVKQFVSNELLSYKFSTAKRNYEGLVRFVKYVDEIRPSLKSFSEITREILLEYYMYLLNAKNETTGKPLGPTGITKAAYALKEVLVLGSVRGWDIPEETGYVQRIYEETIINNQKLRKKRKKRQKRMKDKVIHPKTIDKTIRQAKSDLENNMNIITASAVIIISQLGLRLSELLSIKEDCIEIISGDKMIRYETAKLKKERVEVTKPINTLAYYAINKLKDHTQQLREEAGLPFLFVNRTRNVKGYPPSLISQANFNKNYLRPWIKKHHLTYEDGSLLDFTAHTFRHSFATYALQGGASIETISDILNHQSIRGTQYYTHLLEEQVKERFSEVLNEGAVITGKKALTIKDRLKEDNPFKGKTVEQVDKLRKAMKIQVLSHGLCLHHPMRNEPCEGDGVCLGCNNFITTPDFLEVHRGRLKRVRAELDNVGEEGRDGPFEAKLKHIESYLVDIIDDLENQLEYRGSEDNAEYTS